MLWWHALKLSGFLCFPRSVKRYSRFFLPSGDSNSWIEIRASESSSLKKPRRTTKYPAQPLHLQAPGIHWVPGVVIWKQTKHRITSWKAGALSANSLRRRQSLVCVGTLRQKAEPRGTLPVGAREAEMLLCFTLVAFLFCFMVVFGAQSEPQGHRHDSLTLEHWATPLGREHAQRAACPACRRRCLLP